jgi:hypothetical protein
MDCSMEVAMRKFDPIQFLYSLKPEVLWKFNLISFILAIIFVVWGVCDLIVGKTFFHNANDKLVLAVLIVLLSEKIEKLLQTLPPKIIDFLRRFHNIG